MSSDRRTGASASLTVASRVLPGEHLAGLRSSLRGELLLPEDPGFDQARQAWQLLVDQRPAAVVIAEDVNDVAVTVSAARDLGLHVAPQSTGHAAGAIRTLEDTILLRTARLDSVDIRPESRTAVVGAGAVWREVTAAAAAHGLAALSGMAPSVGVAGFCLGGGLGWLARSHGLAANSVLAVEAVDAQGRVLRIDDEHHAELFWAARGGIAPVIVTALHLRLYPVARVQAGTLIWPLDRAENVASAWQEWVGTVPETVTSLLRFLRFPPLPGVPEAMRGKSFVAVEAAIQSDETTADALLAPLRRLSPVMDSVRPTSPADLGAVHGDPEQPSPGVGESVVLTEISAASVAALLDGALAPESAALVSIELRHLGGALVPGRAAGGAVAAIDGEGLVFVVGMVPAPDALAPVQAAAAAVIERLAAFAAPTAVRNFVERPAASEALYPPDAVDRLRRVADTWDPDRIIRVGHPLN